MCCSHFSFDYFFVCKNLVLPADLFLNQEKWKDWPPLGFVASPGRQRWDCFRFCTCTLVTLYSGGVYLLLCFLYAGVFCHPFFHGVWGGSTWKRDWLKEAPPLGRHTMDHSHSRFIFATLGGSCREMLSRQETEDGGCDSDGQKGVWTLILCRGLSCKPA